MSGFDREGPDRTFASDYASPRAPEPAVGERSRAQQAADAETIAANFDGQAKIVRQKVAAMTAAAAAGDIAGYRDAKQGAHLGLTQLEYIAKGVTKDVAAAAGPDVRRRLEAVDAELARAREAVASAAPEPAGRAPTLRCADALLAVLPTDPPDAAWRKADFDASADAVRQIINRVMTASDLQAFAQILTLPDQEITRRYQRLSEAKRNGIADLLSADLVKQRARAREAAQPKVRDDRPADAQPDAASPPNPSTSEPVSAPPTAGDEGGAPARAAPAAHAAPATELAAPAGGPAATTPAPAAAELKTPPPARGAAIAARVPGVTYEGDGHFRVAAHGRQLDVTIHRVHTGVLRLRPGAGDAVVLEVPTGLGDAELEDAIVSQLAALAAAPAVPFTTTDEAGASVVTPGHSADLAAPPAGGAPFAGSALQSTTQPAAPRTGGAPPRLLAQPASSPSAAAAAGTAPANPATTSDRVAGTASPPHASNEKAAPNAHIPYRVFITKLMSGAEFKVVAQMQIFGAVVTSRWENLKATYTAADSPVELLVDAELFHQARGAANAARGIDTDATGAIVGADARAQAFEAGPASDEKDALLAEIDWRYYKASGTAPGTKIGTGDAGHSELWRAIRDEVLFQSAYLARLPESVKAVLERSIKGLELTPAEYEQLFRIAKRIEALPPGAAADFASKTTATSNDLDALEAGLDTYRGELAAQTQANAARAAVETKLTGREGLYALYLESLAVAKKELQSPTGMKVGLVKREGNGPGIGDQLDEQLHRSGFASVGEFEAFIAQYEKAYEDGAVRITLDILAKYAGKLHAEAQRYQDKDTVAQLHNKLAGFRAQHQAFEQNAQIWNAYAAQTNRDISQERLPGNGTIHAKPPTAEQTQARDKANAAKVGADVSLRALANEYPIFAEDELPPEKRLNKETLARAGKDTLGSVLQEHIADRTGAAAAARAELEGKHDLIYKMAPLKTRFYAELNVEPGSILDKIIQHKASRDSEDQIVGGVLLTVVTVALTVVSFGAATPAVVAAGASIGAAGLSSYMAYDEYQSYTAEHSLAEMGMAADPSLAWLVLAIVGAGVDMGAAMKAVGKIASAAGKVHEAADLAKALEAMQHSAQEADRLEQKIADAANRALAARESYAAAKGQLFAVVARAGMNPFADPEFYLALLKMAVAKIREGGHSLSAFINELRQARIAARLGELAPEDVTKVKEVWTKAESLASRFVDPAVLDTLLTKLDAATLNQFLDRLCRLSDSAFSKFAALDATSLSKFRNIPEASLERLGTLQANFEVFAQASEATIVRLTQLSEFAFTRFATLNKLQTIVDRLGTLDVVALENLALIGDPQTFNIIVRKVGSEQIGRLATLRGEGLSRLGLRLKNNIIKLDVIGSCNPTDIIELAGIADDALLNRFASLSVNEIHGFSGLAVSELDTFERVSADGLSRLSALGDQHALRRFAALGRLNLEKFGEISAGSLRTWSRVPSATLQKLSVLDSVTLGRFGEALAPNALTQLAERIPPAALQELGLVDIAGIRRITSLPPNTFPKLEGINGFGLQRLANLPPGELEHLAGTATVDKLAAAAGDDAVGKAAARNQAQALDRRGALGADDTGHGHSAHGPDSMIPDANGQSPAEKRLRTGLRPDDVQRPIVNNVSAFASDAAQVETARLADIKLQSEIDAGRPLDENGKKEVKVALNGAGYTFKVVEGSIERPITGGAIIKHQCDHALVVYKPLAEDPRSPLDYSILTMFPEP